MKQQTPWMNNIFRIYDRMERRARKGSYFVNCNGLQLLVHKSVYAPDMFSDSSYFAEELPKIVGTGSLLEIGTGTGVIGISCALRGARVTATDINLLALDSASGNAIRNNAFKKMVLKESDIYDSLGNMKFDFIFWSHPYNNWNEKVKTNLLRTGLDYKYESLRKYIEGARHHLNPEGRLLLGTGNTADLKSIVEIAYENQFLPRVLCASEAPLATGNKSKIINMIMQFDDFQKVK